MAMVKTDDRHYRDIADAIRAKNGMNAKYAPGDMGEAVMALEIGEGNDNFWRVYQQNGNRTDYRYAFAGLGWTAETFAPKYNIVCVGVCTSVFQQSAFAGDLAQRLEDLGVTIDTSGATNLSSMFNSASRITRVGVIDISNAPNSNSVFAYCGNLQTIDRLVVIAANVWSYQFQSCAELVNLTIEGTIGTTGLDLRWSTKLSKASIKSVVNALSATTSGLTVTFSNTAVNNAFTTEEWAALKSTRQNWTIALV